MAVTNPDKVVTKQDLADFYEEIFPYLGGMPEMVANKFSRSDIYSTTEKIVGQWTDGKPVYQRVFTGTLTNTSARGTETTTSVSVGASVDVFVKTECYSINNNKYSIVPFYRTSSGTGGYIRCISYNNAVTASPNTVTIANAETTSGTVTYMLIVQYTKTTDSATSIGVDTDYSTTEKIVGTWIDGKAIYQKTWTGALTKTSAIGTEVSTTVAMGVSVDSFVDIRCYAQNNTNKVTQFFNLFASNNSNGCLRFTACPNASTTSNKNVIMLANSWFINDATYYLTVQYTKV